MQQNPNETTAGIGQNLAHDQMTPYQSPDGRNISVHSTMGILMSDDFGGPNTGIVSGPVSNVNPAIWTVYDGGYSPNGFGSGVSGITEQLLNSALVLSMPTTNGAERWYLSNQIFSGSEDVLVLLSKSSANLNQDLFVGLIEVDSSGNPIVNPNLAGYGTNMGGMSIGNSTSTQTMNAQAVADSSPLLASGTGSNTIGFNNTCEYQIEFHAEDIIVSVGQPDTVGGKIATAARVSTQCPNDQRCYKLLIRARNTATTNASVVTIQRVVVVDGQENRVEVASGRGDQNAQKAVAVNVVGNPTVTLSSNPSTVIGQIQFTNSISYAPVNSTHKLFAAASTNATLIGAGTRRLLGGLVTNLNASTKYFLKIYNKASAPTVGTDVPVLTLPLLPNSSIDIVDIVGVYGYTPNLGLAYAITSAYPDADTTAVTNAGDVIVNILYI